MTDAALGRLQARVFETFREETTEGLERLEERLLALGEQGDRSGIDELFRIVHTIKGSAGGFGLKAMSEVAHAMEAYLEALRGGSAASPEGISALLEGRDVLRALLGAPPETNGERYAGLRDRLAAAASNRPDDADPHARATRTVGPATFAVNLRPKPTMLTAGIDPAMLLDQLGTLGPTTIVPDLAQLPALDALNPDICYLTWRAEVEARTDASSLKSLFEWLLDECDVDVTPVKHTKTDAHEQVASVRVPIDKLDAMMNLVGELVIVGSSLADLESAPADAQRAQRAREAHARLARLTRSMHESVLGMRSLPVGLVFRRFQRLVHDLSERFGKQIELQLTGETVELDKTVLERLGDPLVHLVRNSLDHGIELPAERIAAGKPEVGTLSLSARPQGNDVIITVVDDGRGLDPDRIFAKAVEQGLIAADAKLSVPEIQRLILQPGFTTNDTVTDVSGRGVGMDVVASSIRALGGNLQIESTVGVGTTITLQLPLTLAIIEGQLVRFGNRPWVIPLTAISECVAFDPKFASSLLGTGLVYDLRGESVPVLDTAAGFRLSSATGERQILVIVESAGERFALRVDALLARRQVVAKGLEDNLQAVPGVSGATVLGDGSIAFILDVPQLRRICPVARPLPAGVHP